MELHPLVLPHSSAILNRKQANVTHSKVKELSLQIIESQEEEIAEMKRLLEKRQR